MKLIMGLTNISKALLPINIAHDPSCSRRVRIRQQDSMITSPLETQRTESTRSLADQGQWISLVNKRIVRRERFKPDRFVSSMPILFLLSCNESSRFKTALTGPLTQSGLHIPHFIFASHFPKQKTLG